MAVPADDTPGRSFGLYVHHFNHTIHYLIRQYPFCNRIHSPRGSVYSLHEVHLKSPSGSAERLTWIACDMLACMQIGGEVEELTLTLFPLASIEEGFRQADLFDLKGQRQELFEAALRPLQERWGQAVVQRASAVEPPMPSAV